VLQHGMVMAAGGRAGAACARCLSALLPWLRPLSSLDLPSCCLICS
jgi:hypothetical protein